METKPQTMADYVIRDPVGFTTFGLDAQGRAGRVPISLLQGPTGPAGPTGAAGPTGPTGTTGPTGAAGPGNSLTVTSETAVVAERNLVFVDGTSGAQTLKVGGTEVTYNPGINRLGAPSVVSRATAGATPSVELSSLGILFNGDTSAANALDDYEEGTWTPLVEGAVTAGVGTYTTQEGTYTKIGNRVLVRARVAWTAHTGDGGLRITLPLAATGGSTPGSWVAVSYTWTSGVIPMMWFSGSHAAFYGALAGGGSYQVFSLNSTGSLYIAGHYRV